MRLSPSRVLGVVLSIITSCGARYMLALEKQLFCADSSRNFSMDCNRRSFFNSLSKVARLRISC